MGIRWKSPKLHGLGFEGKRIMGTGARVSKLSGSEPEDPKYGAERWQGRTSWEAGRRSVTTVATGTVRGAFLRPGHAPGSLWPCL